MPTVDTAVKPDNRMMRNQIEFRTDFRPAGKGDPLGMSSRRDDLRCAVKTGGDQTGVLGPTGAQNQGLDPLAEVEREDRCAQSDLVHTV